MRNDRPPTPDEAWEAIDAVASEYHAKPGVFTHDDGSAEVAIARVVSTPDGIALVIQLQESMVSLAMDPADWRFIWKEAQVIERGDAPTDPPA